MNVNNPPKVKIVDPSPIIPRELTPPVLGIDLSSSLLFFSEDSTLTGISFLSDVSGFSSGVSGFTSGVSGFTSGVSGFTSGFTSGTSGSFVDLYKSFNTVTTSTLFFGTFIYI